MIRIKVTHGSNPATYHFWNGFTPPKETPSGWGTLIAAAVPILTMTEQEYDDVFRPVADLMFIADGEDLASFNDSSLAVIAAESMDDFGQRVEAAIAEHVLGEDT